MDREPEVTADAADTHHLVPYSASLVRIWAIIARHPTRSAFAASAPVISRNRAAVSIAGGTSLVLAANGLSLLTDLGKSSGQSRATSYLFGAPSVVERVFFDMAVVPATRVALVLAVAYAVAFTMPSAQGTLRQRYWSVLRPWALANFVIGAAALLVTLARSVFIFAAQSQGAVATCADVILLFGQIGYSALVIANALSAGSGKGRWMVIGVALLTYILVIGLLWYAPAAIAHTFGISLFPL